MNEQDKLTLREKFALTLILLAFKVVRPYKYEHEFKEQLEKLNLLLKE